jgi:C-terminal processing protease CtpA/Prc
MPVQYLHPVGWAMWTTPDGELYVTEHELEAPRDEPLRWRGPLAWLIGPGTFSSASSLAAAVQEADIGLLVGEPTGGVCDGFGEVMPIEMPRTRLGGQVSSARHAGPSGLVQPPHGVPPDLAVRAQPGEPGDPVLEAAVAALLATAPSNLFRAP